MEEHETLILVHHLLARSRLALDNTPGYRKPVANLSTVPHPKRRVAGMIDSFTKAIAGLVMSGTGLGLVLFLGSAIIKDLIRDIKGGQWKL